MIKRVFRYFFDFIDGQEKFLNGMAQKGYRLKKCGILSYLFEECPPGKYEYAVEFIGEKSHWKAKDYREFIESLGYRTLTKNINLNFAIGKAKWRPWAKGLGQITTSPGTYNKELLILEKKADGKPFQLHTDLQDLLSGYRTIRSSYLWGTGGMLAIVVMAFIPGISPGTSLASFGFWGIILAAAFGILWGAMVIKYSTMISRLKEESKTNE